MRDKSDGYSELPALSYQPQDVRVAAIGKGEINLVDLLFSEILRDADGGDCIFTGKVWQDSAHLLHFWRQNSRNLITPRGITLKRRRKLARQDAAAHDDNAMALA